MATPPAAHACYHVAPLHGHLGGSHHRRSVCITPPGWVSSQEVNLHHTPHPGMQDPHGRHSPAGIGREEFKDLRPRPPPVPSPAARARVALPARAVELAPLQRDLGHVLPQAHKQDALAVEDLQAPDGLPAPLGEQLHLLQQAAARGVRQRRPHFLNGAVVCGGNGRGERSTVSGQGARPWPPAWLQTRMRSTGGGPGAAPSPSPQRSDPAAGRRAAQPPPASSRLRSGGRSARRLQGAGFAPSPGERRVPEECTRDTGGSVWPCHLRRGGAVTLDASGHVGSLLKPPPVTEASTCGGQLPTGPHEAGNLITPNVRTFVCRPFTPQPAT